MLFLNIFEYILYLLYNYFIFREKRINYIREMVLFMLSSYIFIK